MRETLRLFLLCCAVQLVLASTRLDRVWPLSGTSSVDLGQSSPFGPRLIASGNFRYDFHRGVDIPTPEGTPVYAIDDGKVKIAGNHSSYTDRLVQLEHRGWAESAGTRFYSNYMHLLNVTVAINQQVTKGQLIGYTSHPASGFDHLHFEVRVGRRNQANCCNPWKFLPNANNNYTSFNATVSLNPNPQGQACKANVNVTVPLNELIFNHIELHVYYGEGRHIYVYDMCQANLVYTFSDMDDPKFGDNLEIFPTRFNSQSYANNEPVEYRFEFYDLPNTPVNGGTMYAIAYDVFDNSVVTGVHTYLC